MAFLASKGYVAVDNIFRTGKQNTGTKLGGRVDVKKRIEDIDFTLSLTDATAQDFEAAPWLRDFIVSAEKRLNSNVSFGVGYDLGLKNVFASVATEGTHSGKDVVGKATWFQRGNIVRTEGTVKFDGRNSLWAAYTFNDSANVMNSTFVNLVERNGFIIDPFTYPVATAAAKYTLEYDGYTIEPAVDINRRAPYLAVSKVYKDNVIKAQYAFREEAAMVEVAHKPAKLFSNNPLFRFYFKAPLGRDAGVGPLSIGFIVDKTFDL